MSGNSTFPTIRALRLSEVSRTTASPGANSRQLVTSFRGEHQLTGYDVTVRAMSMV
ncbi:hypothetical protein [Arthrobacter sp. ISL-30]|uniref:hypothetical protein n=1 Tax=Arthrobacter sp. ISL-30 TaxID=2819109 RepID=UPI001BE50C55|nr:hypothetical protein [Arthrobacter sp. ISL-30]MBT2515455.1 hypothetical protein [Arthrobacter sp. ISL-30]